MAYQNQKNVDLHIPQIYSENCLPSFKLDSNKDNSSVSDVRVSHFNTVQMNEVEAVGSLIHKNPRKETCPNNIKHGEGFIPLSEKNLLKKDNFHVLCDISCFNKDFRLSKHKFSEKTFFYNQSKISRACQKSWMLLSNKNDTPLLGYDDKIFNICSNCSSSGNMFSAHSKVLSSGRHKINVITLGLVMSLFFVAADVLRRVQASLISENIFGVTSYTAGIAGFFLGNVISIFFVQNDQHHWLILASVSVNLFSFFSFLFPVTLLLALVSFIQGITQALIWSSVNSYITLMSRAEACKERKPFYNVSSYFFGLFFFIFQSYHIISNVMIKIIVNYLPYLTDYLVMSTSKNDSALITLGTFEPEGKAVNRFSNICGLDFNESNKLEGLSESFRDGPNYLLCIFYITIIVTAIFIVLGHLEPVQQGFYGNIIRREKRKLQILSYFKFLLNRHFLLLFPLMMYSMLQFGFVMRDVTLAYVTCPLSVAMLSYTVVCYGVCASVSSLICGLVSKYVGRVSLLAFAAVLNILELLFISEWTPLSNSLFPYLAMISLWGVAHGIWITQVYYIVGVIFPERYEEAYSGLQLAQGFGVVVVFCLFYVSMLTKIYVMLFSCIIALAFYVALEIWLLKRKKSCRLVITVDST
ncbi:protein unc-93 A-like isoform X1 [Biomphalaria glabrata]|nr:protein unc-93-like protein A-like isoform X1 [Biomphalaria glabrata]